MVNNCGARAGLLLLFELATPNSPPRDVFSTCPLYQRKRHFDVFRMAAHGCSFVSKGWVAVWRGHTEHRQWGQQPIFVPPTRPGKAGDKWSVSIVFFQMLQPHREMKYCSRSIVLCLLTAEHEKQRVEEVEPRPWGPGAPQAWWGPGRLGQ